MTGVHILRVRIAETSSDRRCHVSIGIVQSDAKIINRLWEVGNCRFSFGYSSDGDKCHNRFAETYGEPYGEPYGAGDLIECELDTNKRTLTYYNNGETQGIAFQLDFDGGSTIEFPVRFAISLSSCKLYIM